MWHRKREQEPTRPTCKVPDERTRLPKCPNASSRQALAFYTYCSKNPRHPTVCRPLDKTVNSSYDWQERTVRRSNGYHGRHAEASPVRPRIVTVVRPCGEHTVRKISLLLNRRAVQTYELLIADVSEALGFPCWNSSRVRRLFSPAGREIRSLSDFFHFGHAFLAFGISRPLLSEVQAALDELYPDNPNYRDSLLRLWERILSPKAAKTDSGFHDVSQVGPDVVASSLATQPAANHLQPFLKQVRQERGRKERQREQRSNKEQMITIKAETKDENMTESKKEPVYCQSCRGSGPPIPPIGKKQHDKIPDPYNQNKGNHTPDSSTEKAPQDQPQNKLEKKTLNNLPLIHPKKGLIPLTSADALPQQDMRKAETVEDWCKELPPDDKQVSVEEIQRCYDIGTVVGDGNFAVVHECRVRGCTQTFAMKVVDKNKLNGRNHMIQNEISLLRSLVHPRLVQLLCSHHTATHVYLLMELVSGGDLFDAIARSGRFSEPYAARMIRDISQALEYIHNKSIAHRDIKPENLLVQHNSNGSINLKLADFGLALVVTEPVFTVCGTPTYVAPEILAETGYGVAVDVWAMGVILFVLLSGFPPFRSPERDQEELFRLIQKGEVNFASPYWDHVSEGAKSLIRSLLEVDPKVRLTASQTLQNDWLLTPTDQKEAPDSTNFFISRENQLESKRNYGSDPAKYERSVAAPLTVQNQESRKMNTLKFRPQVHNKETIMVQRDQLTLKRLS